MSPIYVNLTSTVVDSLRRQLKLQPRFRMTPKGEFQRAAVLVPLCHHNGVASVFFTKRPSHLKNHPGQVAFPGGKIDQSDKDETAAALREMHEECGIPPEEIDVLGLLPDAIARGSRQTVVTPILGMLRRDITHTPYQPNPAEVESSFTLPLAYLLDAANSDTYQSTPRFLHPTQAELHVWGFSGYVLKQFLNSNGDLLLAENQTP